MATRVDWARYQMLRDLIVEAQDDFYGDAEDWQPAYMGISPELDEVVIEDDVALIPAGWFIEQACMDADEIVTQYFDLR